jgi:hypothetical protein
MPLAGLPAEVSNVLEALLLTKVMTWYRIISENDVCTVVLRLSDRASENNEGDSHSFLQLDPILQAVPRRKTPSQQRRDRRRAQEFRERRQQKEEKRQASPRHSGILSSPALTSRIRPTTRDSTPCVSPDSGVTLPAEQVSDRVVYPSPPPVIRGVSAKRDIVTSRVSVNINTEARGDSTSDCSSIMKSDDMFEDTFLLTASMSTSPSNSFEVDDEEAAAEVIRHRSMTREIIDRNRLAVSCTFWEKTLSVNLP